jgi:hypothetical protein
MNYSFFTLATLMLLACGDKNPTTESSSTTTDTPAAAQQYFPVIDFLKSEISAVDSLPVGIMQYRSSAAINDSGYIKPEQFHALVDEFVPSGFTDSVFKKDFQETSFLDKNTSGATFFYNAKTPDQNIKRIDVITEKSDSYDKVKSIYIEKIYGNNDIAITKKLHWKPGRNFQLIIQKSKSSGDPETELIKVVWDNRE